MTEAQNQTPDAVQTGEEAAFEKAAAELNATVRDALLTHVRSMETPWSKLAERKQQDMIAAIENTAKHVIRVAVTTIARRGFDSVGIVLKDFQVKDGEIKGKFEASMTSENVLLLAEHGNTTATVVLCDAASFMQGAWAEADKDQPEMPLGGEAAEDEADDDQRRAPRRARG